MRKRARKDNPSSTFVATQPVRPKLSILSTPKRDLGKLPSKALNPFSTWAGKGATLPKGDNGPKIYDLGKGTFSTMALEKVSDSMFRFVDKGADQIGPSNESFNGVFQGVSSESEPPDPVNSQAVTFSVERRNCVWCCSAIYAHPVPINGSWNTDPDTLKSEVNRFYQKLFSVDTIVNPSRLQLDGVPSLDRATVNSLEAHVTMEEVEKSMRRFLWAGNEKDHFHALVSWNWVTSDKYVGGLGARDLRLMNTALLGKLIWSMLYEKHKPWVQVFSSKYLKDGSVLNASLAPNCSPTWRSIILALQELRDGFGPCLNDGGFSLWFVDWMGQGRLFDMVYYVHISDTLLQVRDIVTNDRWDVSSLYTTLSSSCRSVYNWLKEPANPIRWIFNQLTLDDMVLRMFTIWWAWRWRNNMVLDSAPWNINHVIRRVYLDALNLRWAFCEELSTPPIAHSIGSSSVRLSVDGIWFPDRSRLGFGGLIRDSSGRWVIGFSGGRNSGDPCLAELLAVVKGLSLAWELGYRHILCEID
ncbi:Ribonuclease H-like superfamily [Sesbania bispinosa]|nr:Ribonuclease H-like superfamily [Sesbania bispinosa]